MRKSVIFQMPNSGRHLRMLLGNCYFVTDKSAIERYKDISHT
jgi:hypothetical protein